MPGLNCILCQLWLLSLGCLFVCLVGFVCFLDGVGSGGEGRWERTGRSRGRGNGG